MSTSCVTATKKIILRTSDNHEFEVDEAIAMEFGVVKYLYDEDPDNFSETPMPLPNVSSKYLSAIIEYCKSQLAFRARRSSSSVDREAKAYDKEFVQAQDIEWLFEMIQAANYLNIKYLIDMLCQAVADRIKNKSVEYVRRTFGAENDFSPEEEAEVRAQNKWAFHGVDPDDD